MEIQFQNKVVLITGATRGIGKQLALDFEKLGASLILTSTNAIQVKNLNQELEKNNKQNIKYICVDFSNENSSIEFADQLSKYERIDVCVNNAGINKINYIYDTLITDWDNIINVNLKAPFLILREISKIMKKHGYGRIVNIASIFGTISKQKRVIYSTSKSGLIGFTKAAALDLAPFNVLVNCVSPGFVLTDLTKRILTEAEMQELVALIPVGRMASIEEISKVVLFLSSDLNTYITGQNIIVDGGYVNV